MMRQLFKVPSLRTALFGEKAAQIWQSVNEHVAVPKAAFDGFMKTFYEPMGLEEIVPSQTELACPNTMGDHPGKLMLHYGLCYTISYGPYHMAYVHSLPDLFFSWSFIDRMFGFNGRLGNCLYVQLPVNVHDAKLEFC